MLIYRKLPEVKKEHKIRLFCLAKSRGSWECRKFMRLRLRCPLGEDVQGTGSLHVTGCNHKAEPCFWYRVSRTLPTCLKKETECLFFLGPLVEINSSVKNQKPKQTSLSAELLKLDVNHLETLLKFRSWFGSAQDSAFLTGCPHFKQQVWVWKNSTLRKWGLHA